MKSNPHLSSPQSVTQHHAHFEFGDRGAKVQPLPEKQPGLKTKTKRRLADLRQTIADAGVPRKLKHLAGFKRSREESEKEEWRSEKAARIERDCRTHQDRQYRPAKASTVTRIPQRPTPYVNEEELAMLDRTSRRAPSTAPLLPPIVQDNDWAGIAVNYIRQFVAGAESETWKMQYRASEEANTKF